MISDQGDLEAILWPEDGHFAEEAGGRFRHGHLHLRAPLRQFALHRVEPVSDRPQGVLASRQGRVDLRDVPLLHSVSGEIEIRRARDRFTFCEKKDNAV